MYHICKSENQHWLFLHFVGSSLKEICLTNIIARQTQLRQNNCIEHSSKYRNILFHILGNNGTIQAC